MKEADAGYCVKAGRGHAQVRRPPTRAGATATVGKDCWRDRAPAETKAARVRRHPGQRMPRNRHLLLADGRGCRRFVSWLSTGARGGARRHQLRRFMPHDVKRSAPRLSSVTTPPDFLLRRDAVQRCRRRGGRRRGTDPRPAGARPRGGVSLSGAGHRAASGRGSGPDRATSTARRAVGTRRVDD